MTETTNISEAEQALNEQDRRTNAMKFKILRLEQENQKTREKTNEQMVEAIRRIIQDESKKNY